jgi:hypothetical protein
MEGPGAPVAGHQPESCECQPEALSQEEIRQLLLFHGRLMLEHQGFEPREIRHLVFMKWLYLRGHLSEFSGASRPPSPSAV